MQTLLPLPVVPGDQQVRHLREIGDDCFAVNIFAERERQFRFRAGLFPILRLQQLAQRHFHFARVRQLDADRVLAGNWRENLIRSARVARARSRSSATILSTRTPLAG